MFAIFCLFAAFFLELAILAPFGYSSYGAFSPYTVYHTARVFYRVVQSRFYRGLHDAFNGSRDALFVSFLTPRTNVQQRWWSWWDNWVRDNANGDSFAYHPLLHFDPTTHALFALGVVALLALSLLGFAVSR